MQKASALQTIAKTEIVSTDFNQFVNEVTMIFWNRVADFPEFRHLQPQDYPHVFEALQKALRPYQSGAPKLVEAGPSH